MKYYELEHTFNGYCYKNYDNFKSKKGVCYIPEYNTISKDYETEYKIPVDKIDEYTYYTYDDIYNDTYYQLKHFYDEDFNDECVEEITEIVFDMIDWQHPSSLLNEINWSEDIKEIMNRTNKKEELK